MEDVLSVYEMPYDADYPQVSLDEKLVTLHADVTEPLPVQPGQAERVDYEYERLGTANLFVMVGPFPLLLCPQPHSCRAIQRRSGGSTCRGR
jgi:hypothetical protein